MIIDVNSQFGFDRLESTKMDPDSILRQMDKLKIDKSVITCNECMYFDFIEGNNRTAQLVKMHPDRFIGFFSLNTGRYIGVVDEVERAINTLGLTGFRFFFTEVSFGRGWSSGLQSLMLAKVMKKVNDLGLPVFLEAGFSFAQMKTFAEFYPKTKIIAAGAGYANMAEAIIAAQDTENLFIEISGLDAGDGIRFLVNEVSSEKIIFGTNIPFNLGSVAILNVNHTKISDKDKENIFYKNIERILKNN